MSHFLTVIVPVYKQEPTIHKDILTIYNALKKIRYEFELIAVVDGIKIDRSYSILKKIKLPNFSVLGYKKNMGKGYAVRYGMAKSKGDYIAFIDAGMEIDPNGLSMVIEHLEWYNADIIVASKRHPASQVNYPYHRRIISSLAQIFATIFLNINVKDTQAGLKIFKRKVLEKVTPRLLIKNYAFDLEILSVANHLGFRRIYEAPIKLSYNNDALTHAVSPKTLFLCLKDGLAVFYRLRIKKYYDNSSKRQWIYDPELKLRINTGE